jgi:hypothetical protein
MDQIGSLAAVAYSLFVEWNSEHASERVVARAQRYFSAMHVNGSRSHLNIDKKARHYSMILDIAHRLIGRIGSERELFTTVEEIAGLFGAYFCELYDVTIGRRVAVGASHELFGSNYESVRRQ